MDKKSLLYTASLLALLLIPNLFFLFYINEFRTTLLSCNLAFLIFILFLNRFKYTRFSAILVLLCFVVNNGYAIFSTFYFRDLFNVTLALNILTTHSSEAWEMMQEYAAVFMLALFYFLALYHCIQHQFFRHLNYRILILGFCFAIALPSYHLHKEYKHSGIDYRLVKNSKLSIYLRNTPFYSLSSFCDAQDFLDQAKQFKNKTFHYQPFNTESNNIENIVVVLGESARRDALSLYRSPNRTTPLLDKRIDQLYIYDQAVSPAAFTNAAISLLLSKQIPNLNFTIEKNLDNIISLANATDLWETYWISTQENISTYVNMFSMINSRAKNKNWISRSMYDEDVIPEYEKALQDKHQKRLIFVHLKGSHPIPSKRYPSNFKHFTNNSSFINEYNNSIYYTDFVLEQLIQKLENTPSLLLYVSDHGLSSTGTKMVHATTKKGVEVPFFIWHSDYVSDDFKKTGRDNTPISTTNLYNFLMDYMGITGIEYKDRNTRLKVLTSDFTILEYKDMENSP